jgi:hypothetical protein
MEVLAGVGTSTLSERTGMTEQESKEFVEDLVPLFELIGWGDMQGAMAADIAERGPKSLARDFERTVELLRGLATTAAGSVGYGGYLIFDEARSLAETAQGICEQHAKR